MKRLAPVILFLGRAWLVLAVIFIGVGLLGIAWKDGLWAVAQVLSPFNVKNFIVTVITLAPGFLLIWWAGKLRGAPQK